MRDHALPLGWPGRQRKWRNPAFVLIVSSDRGVAERLAAGLAADTAVAYCAADDAGLGTAARQPACTIIDATRKEPARFGRELACIRRSIEPGPCVVYTDPSFSAAALRDAYGIGAAAVLFASEAEYRMLPYRKVAEAQALFVAGDVADRFRDERARRIVHIVVSKACSDLTVSALAAACGGTYKQLRSLCARTGIPEPYGLVVWGRLVFGAYVLGHKWRSVASLARDLGWSDDAMLEQASQKFLHCTPSELRKDGAFSHVLTAFTRILGQIEREERERESTRQGADDTAMREYDRAIIGP